MQNNLTSSGTMLCWLITYTQTYIPGELLCEPTIFLRVYLSIVITVFAVISFQIFETLYMSIKNSCVVLVSDKL